MQGLARAQKAAERRRTPKRGRNLHAQFALAFWSACAAAPLFASPTDCSLPAFSRAVCARVVAAQTNSPARTPGRLSAFLHRARLRCALVQSRNARPRAA